MGKISHQVFLEFPFSFPGLLGGKKKKKKKNLFSQNPKNNFSDCPLIKYLSWTGGPSPGKTIFFESSPKKHLQKIGPKGPQTVFIKKKVPKTKKRARQVLKGPKKNYFPKQNIKNIF